MAEPVPLVVSCVGGEAPLHAPDVVVPWWSISKTCLAACALVLAADGKLQLDKELPGRRFTVRQLLQHTSGLGCYTETPEYEAEVERHSDPWTEDELLSQIASKPLLFEPGQGWTYSNSGYFLVRRLIEQAAGTNIGAALESLVLRPLGIEGSFIAATRNDLSRSIYGDEDDFHPGWVAHGLLMGRPDGVLKFMHRLMTGSLLPGPLVAQMRLRHPVVAKLEDRPWRTAGYGLGLMMDIASPHGLCVGHSGQGPESVSAAYHFPDLDPPLTVAAFAPTDEQGVAERAVIAEAARLR